MLRMTRARTGANGTTTGATRRAADGDENQVPAQAKAVLAKKVNVLQDKSAATKPNALGDKHAPVKQALQSKSTNSTVPANSAVAVKKASTAVAVPAAKPAVKSSGVGAAPGRKPLGEVGNFQQNQIASFKDAKNATTKRPAPEPEQKVKKQRMVDIPKDIKPVKKEKVKVEEDDDNLGALTAVEEEKQDWDDLDAGDECDPLMVSEYVVEIFEYLLELEQQTMPNPDYMDDQKDLQWKMRGILVDWLVEVHHKFRLLPETLFLAINIIDRFLSLRVVSLQKLQLVGLTSMFIASKYEEVMAPSIQNFIYMADGGYTDEEILKAERYILQVLEFGLHYPNPLNFLRRCSKADNYDIQTRTLAKYLMEVALVDHRFLQYPPSNVAASSLYLSRTMLDRPEWDANLRHYSGYTEEQMKPIVDLMLDYLKKPTKHEALFKKYASKKFMKASIFVKDWIEKQQKAELKNKAVEESESEPESEDS